MIGLTLRLFLAYAHVYDYFIFCTSRSFVRNVFVERNSVMYVNCLSLNVFFEVKGTKFGFVIQSLVY